MAELPDFEEFYRAVNGRPPFPWQRRLADVVHEFGWPQGVAVGTGLGKTSSLDVAVWTLAADSERPADRQVAPTRIWYVVNRRLLVDSAYEHGRSLETLLSDPDRASDRNATSVLKAVAVRLSLRSGGAGAHPLHVTRLRGGAELGVRPPDPSQPSMIFSTVPMFASRWLFRGFGSSSGMRPVDAALAGIDSLILLDEAHLAPALLELADPVAQCDVGDPSSVLPVGRARPVFVSLSATGDVASPFGLDKADEAHPIVRRRLDARKPVHLREVRKNRLIDSLVAETELLLGDRLPSRAVIFANSPRTARAVYDELSRRSLIRDGKDRPDLLLLTGRIRNREASTMREAILDPNTGAPVGAKARVKRTTHLIVVATQTLEVGADLDFDVLVSEACGARALTQRLGRLNRLGEIDDAVGAIVFASDETRFGIYGDEPIVVFRQLQSRATDDVIDLGPRGIDWLAHHVEASRPRVGELLPAHLWEWAKTTTPPRDEAPAELFYQGFDEPDAAVSIVWRAVVPDDGLELRPSIVVDESVDIPIWEVREFLERRGLSHVSRLRTDRVSMEREVPVGAIRPGDVMILSPETGGYDSYGWSPDATASVLDVSLLRPPGLPLVPSVFDQLLAPGEELEQAKRLCKVLAEPPGLDDEDRDDKALLAELMSCIALSRPSDRLNAEEWSNLCERLRARVVYLHDGMGRLEILRPTYARGEVDLRSDVFDELSFVATSIRLREHLGSVGELAERIATAIGLPESLVRAVGAAGRFHDLGKIDSRFQRWLDPLASSSEPIAKSSALDPNLTWGRDWEGRRMAAGWPRGGRHEELSRRLVERWLDERRPEWDPDLVLHLVVSHHGYGRPLVAVPLSASLEAQDLRATIDHLEVVASGDLSVIDWRQPARFRRCCERYGYWGLALLEAVVRQADHQVSGVAVA